MSNVRPFVLAALALAVLLVTGQPTTASPGATERVSVAPDGGQGNSMSTLPTISADGRYVAFSSYADNLVLGDTNGCADVFVRDRQTGQTTRVSVDTGGNQGNSESFFEAISGDGRFVTFSSAASNLVSGDTNQHSDAFVHDRQTGQTTRVSVSSAGVQGNGESGYPDISANGRFVAYWSDASNLVPFDPNSVWDIFVRDRDTDGDGIFDEVGAVSTTLVSVDSSGDPGNDNSYDPAVNADGRFVAFVSAASNLVPGDTNMCWGSAAPGHCWDAFVHDRQTGNTTRVSVDSAGNEANSGSAYPPVMSSDGRYVAFGSDASNLVLGDTNDQTDVFVRDRDTDGDGLLDEAGAVSTTRVSVDSAGGQANNSTEQPAISSDGRYVALYSHASNLVPDDADDYWDAFIHDRWSGITTRVSVDSAGGQGNDHSGSPDISADGRYVAFDSSASNLVPGDTCCGDVFLRDVGDTDGDGEWDPFDPCPAIADCDGDAFNDGIEMYLSTDPLDACRDDPADDAWPLDVNVDAMLSVVGDVLNFRGRIGAVPGDPGWWQRLDLNGDGLVSVVGDVLLYRGRIGETCT